VLTAGGNITIDEGSIVEGFGAGNGVAPPRAATSRSKHHEPGATIHSPMRRQHQPDDRATAPSRFFPGQRQVNSGVGNLGNGNIIISAASMVINDPITRAAAAPASSHSGKRTLRHAISTWARHHAW